MDTPATSRRLAPFGTTIFTTMTRLALEHKAINLAQGFPDFDGPEFVKAAAVEALAAGHNQYARSFGAPVLNEAIAGAWKGATGLGVDPAAEVTVTSGCTEALAATFLGLINPGDGVILFEPYYDSYRAGVAMAGGVARFVTLRPAAGGAATHASPQSRTSRGTREEFVFDPDELRRAFEAGARAILVNTPHNPTGKVFTREELSLIAELCIRHEAIAITDEVYEKLVFEQDRPHISLATLPGMAERTVTLSSLGKTFSLTGWKIGWAVAPPRLTAGVRAAHQFLTFATATPFQHAAAVAITRGGEYVASLVEQYRESRDFLGAALSRLGFRVFTPAGTYFIVADHSAFGFADDVEFCTHLTKTVGVAAIPPSVFYDKPADGKRLVRFAFCKKRETLEEAVKRMEEGFR